MADQFMNQIFKLSVASLSQKLGWDASQTSAIDILADIWRRQLLQIGKTCNRYAEHYGRTEVNHNDVILAFRDLNLSIPELEEYIQNFDPVRLPFKLPKFPVPKQSHLNFLRPGSKEVLSRPVHIHEYMPPWEIPEETTEKNNPEKDERKQSVSHPASQAGPSSTATMEQLKPVKVEPEHSSEKAEQNGTEQPTESEAIEPQAIPTESSFRSFASSTKRGSVGENPALKRVRMLMAEEGHPLREISSVMMTTSGYLSSSREGRLPESRPPPNRDFFDPEPVVEKKKKSVTMKKIVEGVKKIEKENQDDEVELFGKPDRLVVPETRHKSDALKKSKEPSKTREETPPAKKHVEKEVRSDKLKIFKKKSRDADKHAKQGRDKTKTEPVPAPEAKLEIKMEQDLEEISSEEGTFQDEIQIKPISIETPHEKKKKKSDEVRSSRKEKKEKRERERLVPGVIPIPRISPKIEFPPAEPPVERESIKQKHKSIAFPPFTFGNPATMKSLKSRRMRHFPDMKSLIPEVSINVAKTLPPLPELKPFFGGMPMAPGLVPANLGPPPPLRFGGSALSPSITITPAAPSLGTSKESRRPTASSLPIPSTVCASVTITRIDMPNTSQEPPPHFESPPTTQHSSGRHSPLPVHHVDSSSGITITPILMTGDSSKAERFEKPTVSGGGGGLALLDEDLSKEQRRKKDKEKRKEIKKEKKKEKKEKLKEKERLQKKDDKPLLVQLHQQKKERKESREGEQMVPKLTLKLHSNASTPVDSPTNRVERTETPPPPAPPARKITIKPIEDLVSKRTPSPELARFSPLVTRPPKQPKVPIPKPSPPVVVAAEKSSERRGSGKSKTKSSKGSSSSQSQQSGLVTETVGFYIDEHGQKVWICPAVGCGREDDGSPMIGCDICDDWYHFACVGIEETPDDNEHWYCPRCVKKGARKGR